MVGRPDSPRHDGNSLHGFGEKDSAPLSPMMLTITTVELEPPADVDEGMLVYCWSAGND